MKSGQRLKSQVCGGEVIVIRANGAEHVLEVGGLPMVDPATEVTHAGAVIPHSGFLLGKRYELSGSADLPADLRIEVMVTRAGSSPLTYAGQELVSSKAKALPTSD